MISTIPKTLALVLINDNENTSAGVAWKQQHWKHCMQLLMLKLYLKLETLSFAFIGHTVLSANQQYCNHCYWLGSATLQTVAVGGISTTKTLIFSAIKTLETLALAAIRTIGTSCCD